MIDSIRHLLMWFCSDILPYLITAVASYSFAIYRERTSNTETHDKEIYAKITKIINDTELMDIVETNGYLPANTFSKCDALNSFIISPGNQFITKELNRALSDFQHSFFEFNNLYFSSSYGDYVGNDKYKLVADKYKSGDPREGILLKQASELRKKTEEDYRYFRSLIKKKLYI